jgi:molybdate transport system ATP-binding protein
MGLAVKLVKKVHGFLLDVEWEIGDEVAVLFGKSGAGKSMTLQLIAGLMEPDTGFIRSNGTVFFDQASRIDLPPQERSLGYVFQDRILFPHMTVRENIAYGLKEGSTAERQTRVSDMIRLFRLEGLGDRVPSEISGGQKQRVALARALIGRPKALLLDEPFTALDSSLRAEMRELLQEVRNEFGIPVVLVTHDFEDAHLLGDRIMIYIDGRVEQAGSKDDVFLRPRTKEVAAFLGMKNLYAARVSGRVESSKRLLLEVNGHLFSVPGDNCGNAFQVGQEVDLYVRPEEVMILREEKTIREALKLNILRGMIVDITDRRRDYAVHVRTEEGELPFEIAIPNYAFRNLNLSEGKTVRISLRDESLWVMPCPPL